MPDGNYFDQFDPAQPQQSEGVPKDQALGIIRRNESGGQNIFSNVDVPGYTREQRGSGYYQIIPSTWQEGKRLAGVDPAQYPLAIDAPFDVQHRVASALYDRYGVQPWAGNPNTMADLHGQPNYFDRFDARPAPNYFDQFDQAHEPTSREIVEKAKQEPNQHLGKEGWKQLPMAQLDTGPTQNRPDVQAEVNASLAQDPLLRSVAVPTESELSPAGKALNEATGRITGAMGEAYRGTDLLTPSAQAFADKWGLGGDARALGVVLKAFNAAWAGGVQATYEAIKGLGLPEEAARDAAAYVESAGMTGAPHAPIMESLGAAGEGRAAVRAPAEVSPATEARMTPQPPAEASQPTAVQEATAEAPQATLEKVATGQPAPAAMPTLERMAQEAQGRNQAASSPEPQQAAAQTPEAAAMQEAAAPTGQLPETVVTAQKPTPEEMAAANAEPEQAPTAQAVPDLEQPGGEEPAPQPEAPPTEQPAPEQASSASPEAQTPEPAALYSFPGPLVEPFAEEAGRAMESLGRGAEEIKAGLAPTSLAGAKAVEYRLRREITGPAARAYDQAMFRIDDGRREVNKLPQAEQEESAYRFETGQKQSTPELQKAADELRSLTNEWTSKIQSLGKGHLENVIDNYMGHIWSNYQTNPGLVSAIASVVRRQPLRGKASFLKERFYPTQRAGIEAGLTPTTWNWVDTQMVKVHEMQKFYYGQKFADAMKADKIATWVPESEAWQAERDGMVRLNDRVFQPRLYGAGQAGPVIPGGYYAPADAARIFNNYMSSGIGDSLLYKGMNRANQALNSMQLGFSGFHASFVLADTAISKGALGLQQISRGELGRGIGNWLFGKTILPAAAQTFWQGRKVLNAWKDPATASPSSRMIADAYEKAGGRATMPDFFRANASGSFFKTVGDLKNPQSAGYEIWQMFKDAKGPLERAVAVPFKIAMRAVDTLQQPLMGYLVPRMKAGVFADLAQDWMRRNPAATLDQLSEAMTKVQDSVDNRIGQLNYDNLFWNKTLKDMAFIAMRSVGWNIGTVREIGGGFVDSASAIKAMAQGRAPQLTTRMAYVMELPIITAEIGAILTYLSTGRAPQSDSQSDLAGVLPLDYFYPPTGGVDQNGVPERRSIPGYMKDVIAFAHDPQQTIMNKTSPMLEALNELRTNRDYYGGIIYDPERDHMLPAYGDFLLNQTAPFSFRAAGRLESQGASSLDKSLAFFGFQPAPQSITQPEKGEAWEKRQRMQAYKRREKEAAKGNYTHFLNAPP